METFQPDVHVFEIQEPTFRGRFALEVYKYPSSVYQRFLNGTCALSLILMNAEDKEDYDIDNSKNRHQVVRVQRNQHDSSTFWFEFASCQMLVPAHHIEESIRALMNDVQRVQRARPIRAWLAAGEDQIFRFRAQVDRILLAAESDKATWLDIFASFASFCRVHYIARCLPQSEFETELRAILRSEADSDSGLPHKHEEPQRARTFYVSWETTKAEFICPQREPTFEPWLGAQGVCSFQLQDCNHQDEDSVCPHQPWIVKAFIEARSESEVWQQVGECYPHFIYSSCQLAKDLK